MTKLIKKIFRTKAQRNVQKTINNYNIDTLSNLYFPEIAKEIAQRQKVERFFSNLNTEC